MTSTKLKTHADNVIRSLLLEGFNSEQIIEAMHDNEYLELCSIGIDVSECVIDFLS